MKKKIAVAISVIFLLLIFAYTASAANQQFSVKPDKINIGLWFKGKTLTISGLVPPGSDLYLKLVSLPVKVSLNKKGKIGPFWMNVQNVQVENMPKMYQIFTSDSISSLPPQLQEQLNIDDRYTYAKNKARVVKHREGEKEVLPLRETEEFSNTLIKMYEKRGLYVIKEKAIKIQSNGRYEVNISLPASVSQGENFISAYAIKDNRVVQKNEWQLEVVSIGIVGWIRDLATTRGPMYGTFAVVIALVAGLVISEIFRGLDKLFQARSTEKA